MFASKQSMREWVEKTLKTRFPQDAVEVADLTGTDDHFQAVIVAEEFEGKNTVARHRMVYQALGDAMRERVHALTLKTYAPKEMSHGNK